MYGVTMNVRAPHRFLRMGSRCWLCNTNAGSGNDRFLVYGISRGGRRVETWVDARDLGNYRVAWIEHPHGQDHRFAFDTREQADAWAAAVGGAYASGPVRPHAAAHGHQA